MSAELRGFLKRHIIDSGPVDVGAFMSIVLGHPRYGYYMRQNPIGRGGDFTTSPEISQMFGEMLGAWTAQLWMQMDKPAPLALIDCGPGQGTMMADILRATKNVDAFHRALRVLLIEISPALKTLQKEKLKEYLPQWISGLSKYESRAPFILLANEFLDALPVRQFVRGESGWAERVVALKDGEFVFDVAEAAAQHIEELDARYDAAPGDIVEISPVRTNFFRQVCRKVKYCGGAALFIDYGHLRRLPGETLQAVRAHAYCDVLEDVGSADLTAHVDFAALQEIAEAENVHVCGPVTQGEFLKRLGIEARAHALLEKAEYSQRNDILTALVRLTDERNMGELFKVMAIVPDENVKPAGF